MANNANLTNNNMSFRESTLGNQDRDHLLDEEMEDDEYYGEEYDSEEE